MEKRVLMAFAFGLFALMALAIAAAADKDSETAKMPPLPKNVTANITYGNCVAFQATQKNACYHLVKSTYKECSDAAKNVTGAKAKQFKQCLIDYKKEMKECKTKFKDAKKRICGPIKHNFIDEIAGNLR